MDHRRILELALEGLMQQRTTLDAEIQTIQSELRGRPAAAATREAKSIKPSAPKRRKPRSAAQRKAHSARMKAYWASKREAVSAKAKRVAPKARKRRAKTAAERKALSLKMKEAWARRKAAAREAR